MTAIPGWASKNQMIQDQAKSSNDSRSSQIPLTELTMYTERAPALGQVMFWVRDLRLKLDQSDVSKVTFVWHKKATTPVSLAPNERSLVQKNK